VSHEQLAKYYNAADVFVLPSRSEGFAQAYIESLLSGTPVLGFCENIEEMDELLGIYVGEKFDAGKEDEKALAEKVTKVLNTDFDRKLLRTKVKESFSRDVIFNSYDQAYKEMLG